VTESRSPNSARPERAFLDANVIYGQQTTDILLSLANRDVFEPRWTQRVIEEMRRNISPDLAPTGIDRRIRTMNQAFPAAMTSAPPQELQDQMHADPKDKHVLAAAVQSDSDVLVTDNLGDFDPPSSGLHSMRVEGLNQFLIRKLEQDQDRVMAGLQDMLRRYKRDPRTMSALINTMVEGQQLRDFAHKLNAVVPPSQRGTSGTLLANQPCSAQYAALEGVARPDAARTPTTSPDARSTTEQKLRKARGAEPDGRLS
jgi:predicted nucleic acid-binding protein